MCSIIVTVSILESGLQLVRAGSSHTAGLQASTGPSLSVAEQVSHRQVFDRVSAGHLEGLLHASKDGKHEQRPHTKSFCWCMGIRKQHCGRLCCWPSSLDQDAMYSKRQCSLMGTCTIKISR